MTGVLTATGGFLLAVLWMDLMFDVQARKSGVVLDGAVLDSITAYYRRATTDSQPMAALIPVVMAVLLVGLAGEAVFGGTPGWLVGLSAVLAGGPICLALLRTVRSAVRLGSRTDSPAEQSRLARAVLRDHIIGVVGMSSFVALWVTRSLN